MAQFEYRCPVHGRIRDVDMDQPAERPPPTCPIIEDEARCGLPLYMADPSDYRND